MNLVLSQFLVLFLSITLAIPLRAGSASAANELWTQTEYDYEAFDNLIHSTGDSLENYFLTEVCDGIRQR